jgi:hypothetical protein
MIWVAVFLVAILGPLALAVVGLIHARRVPAGATSAWNWKLTVASTLLYVLAFNLTFFIQELFLVVPKALTPGLRPTLFHNNHRWDGDNPLASLFQGTGALAIFVSGVVCALLLRRRGWSTTARLLLIWMAYNGLFQSLPQVVVGALNPANDVGMAMEYLQLSPTTKTIAALVAMAALAPIAIGLTRSLLGLAENPADIDSARARTRFIFFIATLPALMAILLIVPFRVPRELLEVLLPPVLVTVVGMSWIQASAWRVTVAPESASSRVSAFAWPLGAVLALLAIFQLVLRPGIHFY